MFTLRFGDTGWLVYVYVPIQFTYVTNLCLARYLIFGGWMLLCDWLDVVTVL